MCRLKERTRRSLHRFWINVHYETLGSLTIFLHVNPVDVEKTLLQRDKRDYNVIVWLQSISHTTKL